MELLSLSLTAEEKEQMITNILTCHDSATSDQRARGMNWYPVAHELAKMIGGDVHTGAGLLAVLSAQRQWLQTVRLSYQAASGQRIKTMTEQRRKVDLILQGTDPVTLLPMSRKTGQFYLCITQPKHETAVCVDRHAHDIARAACYGDFNRGLSTQKRYDSVAGAYMAAAKRAGITPCEMQAITWVVWTESDTLESAS